MRKDINMYISVLLFIIMMGSNTVMAQYNPENPPEPTVQVSSQSYRLYLASSPEEACSFNLTSGSKVKKDSWVYISATPNQDFDFLGWFENNTKISSDMSFNYQMKGQDVTLVAKFKYNPYNPSEPISQQTDVDNTAPVGDANGDGVVNVADIVEVTNAINGKPSSRYNAKNANADGIGGVNKDDIDAIVNIIMNRK